MKAEIIESGIRAKFPAAYSVLPDGNPMLFAFSRARLGLAYYGTDLVQGGQYTLLPDADTPEALGQIADIPSALMAAIMGSIYAVEHAPNPLEKLDGWRIVLHSSSSSIRADEACRDCGRVHSICLASIEGIRDVAKGICCPQLNLTCLTTSGKPFSMRSVPPADLTHPPREARGTDHRPVPATASSPDPVASGQPPASSWGTGGTWPPRHPPTPLPRRSYATAPDHGRDYLPSDPASGAPGDTIGSPQERREGFSVGELPQPPLYVAGTPLQSPSLESDIMHSAPGRMVTPQDGSDVMISLQDGTGGSAVHPRHLIRGSLAHRLVSASAKESDRQEFFRYQRTYHYERLHAQVTRSLQVKTITPFTGSGCLKEYATWKVTIQQFCFDWGIANPIVQGNVAQWTFQERAAKWWLAHRIYTPPRLYSFLQVLEWARIELSPRSSLEASQMEWSSLEYRGCLKKYFKKVQDLKLQFQTSPMAAHLLASRPFGIELQDEVRAAHARAGPGGLFDEQWEALVTSYVRRKENTYGFLRWGDPKCEPAFRDTRVQSRNIQADVDLPQLVPVGQATEEERAAQLCAAEASPKKDLGPVRFGKGPRPCFCCGQEGHSWIVCSKKVAGKCGVCASQEHPTYRCHRRYQPAPESRVNCVVSLPADQVPTGVRTLASDREGTTLSADKEEEDDDEKTEAERGATCNNVQVVATPETLAASALEGSDKFRPLRGLCGDLPPEAVSQETTPPHDGLPAWLNAVYAREQEVHPEQQVQPSRDPAEGGLLYYPVSYQGHPCPTLLDCGATHSFFSKDWLRKRGIPTEVVPKPIALGVFDGPTKQTIKEMCRITHVTVGTLDVAWTFLVLDRAAHDAILGLDFMRAHGLLYDLRTDLLITLRRTDPPLRQPERSPEPPGTNGNDDQDSDSPDVLLSHLYVSEPEWATGGHFDQSGTRVQLDNRGTQEYLVLCSVTADTPEEAEELRKAREAMPADLLAVVDGAPRLFAPPDSEPPERETKHHIKLVRDAAPVKRSPYPLSPPKLAAMHEQMAELVRQGWVEQSTSPWGAPVLFVPKKNGTLRMCVDFQDLNSVTVDDSYPLPRLEVLLHRSANATVFSKLDLASGFHQIEVERDSRPMTAFRLPEAAAGSSLWQWKVMPFGLRNAPPTFQRAMSLALDGCDHCAVVYIDDILIFSKTRDEHLEHLRLIFGKLQAHSYHARLNKCEFLQDEVEFLGHKISARGIATHPDKVQTLLQWPTPLTTAKQVKAFMGLVTWYRSFIPHLATIAAPLYKLMSTRADFVWTPEAATAMETLQKLVSAAPILRRWEPGRPTRVITDASLVGIGAVLEQRHGDDWHPVAFWSRKLKDPETRYSATDREWLAIVAAVTRVWPWLLEASPFEVHSDHKALQSKLCKARHDPPLNDRQARWIEAMMPFPYSFQWIKGETNTVADALSRYPASANSAYVVHAAHVGLWKRLRYLAAQDPEYRKLRVLAQDPKTDLSEWKGVVLDGVGRIFVPDNDEIRTLLISENHDSAFSGHFGAKRTQGLVQRHWTWHGLARDVRDYVRSCRECQVQKHSTHPTHGKLHPITARRPWQIVTLDLVGGLPPAGPRKQTYVLVMVDKFSKYVCLEPCSAELSALETAQIFLRRVIAEHGVPQVVISDRGPQFASQVWEQLLKLLGSRVALAASHHPQTDGQSERSIQTALRLIRTYAHKCPETWVDQLPFLQFAMNNASSAATAYSPFQVLFGRSPVTPADLWQGPTPVDPPKGVHQALGVEAQAVSKWLRDWWTARKDLSSVVHAHLERAAEDMKRRHDAKHKRLLLEPDDLVLLSVKSHSLFEGRRKMGPRYAGPYVVKRKIHENTYELSGLPPEVPPSQNIRFLRHFYPSPRKFADRPDAQFARPIKVDSHVEWEVEAITGHKSAPAGTRYKIKWVGERQQHWLRAKQLRNCQKLLREYQREHRIPLSFWSDSEDLSDDSDPGSETEATGHPAPSENKDASPAASQPLPGGSPAK